MTDNHEIQITKRIHKSSTDLEWSARKLLCLCWWFINRKEKRRKIGLKVFKERLQPDFSDPYWMHGQMMMMSKCLTKYQPISVSWWSDQFIQY